MITIDELKKRADAPVVVADQTGTVIYVNQAFSAAFGWTPQEMIGQNLSRIIPRQLHDAHHLGFSRFLTSERATLLNSPLNLRAVDKNGREFDAQHFIIAEKQDGQWFFGATIKPMIPST